LKASLKHKAHESVLRYRIDLPEFRVDFGFTTRTFGLKPGASARFERALAETSDPEVKEFFAGTVGYGTQVHSDRVAEVRAAGRPAVRFEETDGFLTLEPGVRLLVFSADCLPLFLYVASPTPAVGLVHAGWRGTRLGIGRKAATLLARKAGARPDAVKAVLGPCLRACCYEVGEEFKAYFPKTVSQDPKTDRLRFDLAAENIRQLGDAGIPSANVRDLGLCTACRSDLFYSYRREGDKADRLISWISISNLK